MSVLYSANRLKPWNKWRSKDWRQKGASTLLFNQTITGTERASDIKTNPRNGLAALTFPASERFCCNAARPSLVLVLNQKLPI
jgi:hypothetical protein